jgi:hypothetical protein
MRKDAQEDLMAVHVQIKDKVEMRGGIQKRMVEK